MFDFKKRLEPTSKRNQVNKLLKSLGINFECNLLLDNLCFEFVHARLWVGLALLLVPHVPPPLAQQHLIPNLKDQKCEDCSQLLKVQALTAVIPFSLSYDKFDSVSISFLLNAY